MENIDIISLDTNIQKHFKNEEQNLENYKQKIIEIENILQKKDNKLEKTSIKKLLKTIEDYEIKIENIKNGDNYNFYITESLPILEKYKKILRTPVKINFFGNTSTSKEQQENKEIKGKLIEDFLQIAKKYMLINNSDINIKDKKVFCVECKSSKTMLSEGIFLICSDCGYEEEVYSNTLSYKDISRTNILQKYTYERRSHFRDCINQFQGKQNCKINKKVYDDLEEQFEKHHLLLGDKDTPKEKRFYNVKKEHILLFLKELHYDKHYENVNYIYSQLTGVTCPDISHLEDQLMSDFDILVDLYIKKFKYEKKIDRKSFMNINYVFFQLLNKNKYPCRKEDFNILKTIDRKAFHDDIFKELFEELGWNHKPFF
jgi:hypothetical protein